MSLRSSCNSLARHAAAGASRTLSTSASACAAASSSSSASSSSASSSSAKVYPSVLSRTALRPSTKSGTTDIPLQIGPMQLNRLEEHYHCTLAPSLLYMTHDPKWSLPASSQSQTQTQTQRQTHSTLDSVESDPPASARLQGQAKGMREWDPSSPYSKNRPLRPPRGGRVPQPGGLASPFWADPTRDVVQLDRIVITAYCRDAIYNRNALIPLVAQLRAITGVSNRGSHADPAMGLDVANAQPAPLAARARGEVHILRSGPGSSAFRLRQGIPVGAQAYLPRPTALQFLEVLTTFVLPRMRSFPGFVLPPASQPPASPAALSGVVSLGLTDEAMALFPQTEINWDAYPPKGIGFQVDCITNQRGPRATERARQLLSGLGVPFVRRGDIRST